jgi:hypothetical protein
VSRPPHSSCFDHPNSIWWWVRSSLCSLLHSPVTSSLLGPNALLSTLFANTGIYKGIIIQLIYVQKFQQCRFLR